MTIQNPYSSNVPLELKLYRKTNTNNVVKIVNGSPLIATNVSLYIKVSYLNSSLSFVENELNQYITSYIQEQILEYLYKTSRNFNVDINEFKFSLTRI